MYRVLRGPGTPAEVFRVCHGKNSNPFTRLPDTRQHPTNSQAELTATSKLGSIHYAQCTCGIMIVSPKAVFRMRPPNSQTTHGRFIASSWQTMCSVDGSQSTQPFGLFAVPAVHVTPSQEPEQATGGRRLAAGLRKVSFQIWPRCGLGKVIGSRKSMSCSSPCMRLYWRIWNACWVKRALAGGCEGYSSPDDLVDSRGEAWTLSVRTPAGLSKSQHLTFVRYSISQYRQVMPPIV